MTRATNARIAGFTFLAYWWWLCPPARGMAPRRFATVIWLPMLAFEVTVGLWLLARGVAGDARRPGNPLSSVAV